MAKKLRVSPRVLASNENSMGVEVDRAPNGALRLKNPEKVRARAKEREKGRTSDKSRGRSR